MSRYEFNTEVSENGVLAESNDIHEGIGTYNLLVDIGKFVGSGHGFDPQEHGALTPNLYDSHERGVVCSYCGCDRAEVSAHTEVPESTQGRCHNCDVVLWNV